MSRLVVVRHAKSDYPWGVSDHDRPLNDRGRRDAPALGAWLDAHVTWSDRAPTVLVSTARRAQLTWGLARSSMSEAWGTADVRDEGRIYEAGVGTLIAVAREVAGEADEPDTLVMVGHNPGLAGLVHAMALPTALRDEATSKFPTSAVAVLESAEPLSAALAQPGGFSVAAFAVPRG
jgi:phosphohistidine phosphatase